MTIFPIAYTTNMSITELPSKNKPNANARILHYIVTYCIDKEAIKDKMPVKLLAYRFWHLNLVYQCVFTTYVCIYIYKNPYLYPSVQLFKLCQ